MSAATAPTTTFDGPSHAVRPRRERVRRIDRFCDRLFGDLDGEVTALTRAVESCAGHSLPPPREASGRLPKSV